MRPDPQDRLTDDRPRSGFPLVPLIAVVAVAALAFWFFTGEDEAPPPSIEPVAESVPPPAPVEPPAPDIPYAPPPPAEDAPAAPPEPVAPPLTLADSDEVMRARLAAAGQSDLVDDALAQDMLIERAAAVVDTLSRGLLERKVLPIAGPEKKFGVVESSGQVLMDPAGYARFDTYARSVDEIDVGVLVEAFHLARPLLERSYASLGYAPEELDNALIRALDRIIAAPSLDAPPALVRDEAVYGYADPALEALAPVQKLLLRMGPDNAALVRSKASELRAALLNTPGGPAPAAP